MNLPPPIVSLAGVLLLAAALRFRRGGRGRGFVEYAPGRRAELRGRGLIEPEHFLDLPGNVVSGHADRRVSRVALGDRPDDPTVYLKLEHRVGPTVRLAAALDGCGFVSRSLREAHLLQALQREGLAGPQWLATGEDGRGRAFLLVEAVPGAVDLRAYLRTESDPIRRRRLARTVGRELARIHAAGFSHPDLYAKHVLVEPGAVAVRFLDWQRARRRRTVTQADRARDLAALDATVAVELARPRERLACLRAYVAEHRELLRPLLFAVAVQVQRLRRKRHIVEKSQPSTPAERQEWVCVEGDALCVTPGLEQAWPGRAPNWLSLDRQPKSPTTGATRRWLNTPKGAPALLISRRSFRPLAAAWAWLRGKPLTSPEQKQAGLLFRLRRHAVPAPVVLAMGQRQSAPGLVESFLLTAPTAAVPLDSWLNRQATRSGAGRRRLLRETGALLHRLHDAGCYGGGPALSVEIEDGFAPEPVLARADGLSARRRSSPLYAWRDLETLQRRLAAAGCSRTDLLCLRSGYGRPLRRPSPTPHAPRTTPRPTGDVSMLGPPTPAVPEGRRAGFLSRLFRGVRRIWQTDEWRSYAPPDWAAALMDSAVTDRFSAKQGRSTGRVVLPGRSAADRPLVIYLKRHYQLPWRLRLMATLWPRGDWSPAMQELRHLEWARSQGVPVPDALAAGEYVGPAGRLSSFLAVRELTDMLPLNEAVPLAAARLDAPTFRRWKKSLVLEMARLSRLLHDRRCFHKDLYLCHFYIHRDDTRALPAGPAGWRGLVHLIDLHRLDHHPWTWSWWLLKDLAQLLYSSEVVGVDVRDRLAFWRAYRGDGPRSAADGWLRRLVLFKWGRYRRHNARRKRRTEAARVREAG